MKKLYWLSSCSTCKKILKKVKAVQLGFELQDIGTEKISSEQLTEMKDLAGSYDALFSRSAIKYREMGLKEKKLKENDLKNLILQEYTFLKRPVFIVRDKIFAGSEKKTIEELEKYLKQETAP
jgi:arsenate reductase